MTPPQTVIYSRDQAHEPAWHYYSMPVSVVGGAESLDVARSRYRDALAYAVKSDELPQLREFLEIEVAGLGVWVRTPLERPNSEWVAGELARQIHADQDWFFAQPTVGGYPVVVVGVPDKPVSDILEQMTEFDSLIVMAPHQTFGSVHDVWLAVTGSKAENRIDEPLTSVGSLGLTPESSQRELFDAAIHHHVNRLSALVA